MLEARGGQPAEPQTLEDFDLYPGWHEGEGLEQPGLLDYCLGLRAENGWGGTRGDSGGGGSSRLILSLYSQALGRGFQGTDMAQVSSRYLSGSREVSTGSDQRGAS